MSQLKPNINQLLGQVLEQHQARVMTVLDGRVVSYDPNFQTADVEIMVYEREGEPWVVLPDVPVAFPSTQQVRVAFGLEPGDTGLVLCHYLNPHLAWEQGEVSPAATDDLHGLYCEFLPRRVAVGTEWGDAPPAGDLVLGRVDGQTQITITDGLVTLTGAAVDLAGASDYVALAAKVDQAVSDLKTAIGAGFTAVGVSTAANGPAGKTAFDSAAAAIQSTAASDVRAS